MLGWGWAPTHMEIIPKKTALPAPSLGDSFPIHSVLDRIPTWRGLPLLQLACLLPAGCVHMCVYMFSKGLVPENTAPLPHSCCIPPDPHFYLRPPTPTPVPWSGDWGMSLAPFPGCRGHRAGLVWGSGSVRTPGLTRRWAQALNSPRALCLMGRLVGEAPGWSRDGLEPWGFPCGERVGGESGGGNKREYLELEEEGGCVWGVAESGSWWL